MPTAVAGMVSPGRRLARERHTVAKLIAIYCRHHHRACGLCADCAALAVYARQRLDRCPYGTAKPTCANCPIHCYRREMRESIRAVMAYAGPRLMVRHPVLALLHALDGRFSGSAARPRSRTA